jgi:hypothetical protein
MSAGLAFFFLFNAGVPCCAKLRATGPEGEPLWCRRGSRGLLRSCHEPYHKWQNAKLLFDSESRRAAANTILRGVDGKVATVGAVIAFAALIVNIGMLTINYAKM